MVESYDRQAAGAGRLGAGLAGSQAGNQLQTLRGNTHIRRNPLSRIRLAVVAGVLVIFISVAAYLIFGYQKPAPQHVTFNVTLTGAKSMKPSELTARQNDTITINIAGDTTGEAHLHGYDIAFDCVAGQVVSHTFKATISGGPFDIEWESTSAHLGDLIVNP